MRCVAPISMSYEGGTGHCYQKARRRSCGRISQTASIARAVPSSTETAILVSSSARMASRRWPPRRPAAKSRARSSHGTPLPSSPGMNKLLGNHIWAALRRRRQVSDVAFLRSYAACRWRRTRWRGESRCKALRIPFPESCGDGTRPVRVSGSAGGRRRRRCRCCVSSRGQEEGTRSR